VLIKLVGKAVKLIETGHVPLYIAGVRAEGALCLTVAVSDTAPGISQADQGRVFNAFEQVDGKLTRKHGGTGLGLAISRKIVGLMGGDITLRSQPGRGSRFELTVVMQVADMAGVTAEKEARNAEVCTPGRLRGVRILLAEDNRTNAKLVDRFLAKSGADLSHVEDGLAAVERFRNWHPDIVLMDVSMPGMSGIDATQAIREIEANSDGPAARIIALTANAFAEDRDRCLQAGMDDFLSKPIRKADLLGALTQAAQMSGQGARGAALEHAP